METRGIVFLISIRFSLFIYFSYFIFVFFFHFESIDFWGEFMYAGLAGWCVTFLARATHAGEYDAYGLNTLVISFY